MQQNVSSVRKQTVSNFTVSIDCVRSVRKHTVSNCNVSIDYISSVRKDTVSNRAVSIDYVLRANKLHAHPGIKERGRYQSNSYKSRIDYFFLITNGSCFFNAGTLRLFCLLQTSQRISAARARSHRLHSAKYSGRENRRTKITIFGINDKT